MLIVDGEDLVVASSDCCCCYCRSDGRGAALDELPADLLYRPGDLAESVAEDLVVQTAEVLIHAARGRWRRETLFRGIPQDISCVTAWP